MENEQDNDSTLRRNMIYSVASAAIQTALILVQFALISRYLSKVEVGTYSLVLTLLAFVHALSCVGGIRTVITRELTQRDEKAKIFSSGIAAEFMMSFCALVASIATIYSFEYFAPIRFPLAIAIVLMFSGFASMGFLSLLHSQEKIGHFCFANSFGLIASTILFYICVTSDFSLAWILAAHMSWRFFSGPIMIALTNWKGYISLPAIEWSEIKSQVKASLPITMMIFITQLYVRIDIVMLDYFKGKETVAIYSAAYSFLDYLMILSNSVIMAAFPRFTAVLHHKRDEFGSLYRKVLLVYLKYLFPIGILIAILAPNIIELLYGDTYLSAATPLQVLMAAALIAWVNGPSGTTFIGLRKQNLYMWGAALSLCVNVGINFLLIPSYGALGAAIATVCTELVLCLWSLSLIKFLLKKSNAGS